MTQGRMLVWMALAMGTITVGRAKAQATPDVGAAYYAAHCSMCHGPNRQGNPPTFPSLVGVGKRMTEAQIVELLHTGRKVMPAVPTLQGAELAAVIRFLETDPVMPAQAAAPPPVASAAGPVHAGDIAAGSASFRQNCAFCHGRDAMGGESGPDLTRSKLVLSDVSGNKIGEVIRAGRQNTEKKMPAFNFSDQEILNVSAFIHSQVEKAAASAKKPGGRKGVDVADLQTGNVEAGKSYFNGAGTCSSCHSATGDLAHVASKYEGLQLEMQMLYPRNAKFKGTVTLPTGEKVTGIVAYKDEFVVGLKTEDGTYRSWSLDKVKYVEDAPVKMHAELFPKYTDKDIHDLMAYIQTLK